ncbi:MAG: hypothetical protein JNK15_07335 [Planctomycetes bacterium]|nr:hypothetical protein [Planctomycetota bacterium]
MKPAQFALASGFVFVSSVVAQSDPLPPLPVVPAVELDILLQPGRVQFDVAAPAPQFVGIVIVSGVPDLVHFLVDLPPLLDQAIVADFGLAVNGVYTSVLPDIAFPPGMSIYAQGVALGEFGILASGVGSFVLDASGQK